MKNILGAVLFVTLGIELFPPPFIYAVENPAKMKQEVGLTQKIGSGVSLDLKFTDSTGSTHPLSYYITKGVPAIIVPVYYHCPRLCGLVTKGVFKALRQINLTPGKDYSLLFISIDTSESYKLAAQRKKERHSFLEGSRIKLSDYHFLVGKDRSVSTLMDEIGYRYKKDGDDYAHTAAIAILTPDGTISRYFTGIDFPPGDLRLSLVEASKGEIGDIIDQVLLYCFRFDPTKGRYTWVALNTMKVGGVITLALLGTLLGVLWLKS
ncbi:MAG: SCO family protein [Candidatus Dadabacteria bacterium]|nr:MAG: SCO family protein [Candidatus Dadabacteria bacterium]